MNETPNCSCHSPGYCPHHGRVVTRTGAAVWRRGDPGDIARYFAPAPRRQPVPPPAPRAAQPGRPGDKGRGDCLYLGPAVMGADGKQATRVCGPCGGKTRLKVFRCAHPAHGQITLDDCKRCRDYRPKAEGEGMWGGVPRDRGTMPVDMVVPSDRRPHIFRGGVLQIMVTRSCDLSCFSCSAGSNLISKPAVMTPEQFEQAVDSLEGYPGVYGLFGGNPCSSRYFEDYCRILRAKVPFEARGIWTNNLLGKGALARITFNPKVSNCNVHCSEEAFREFERDWPEAIAARREHVDRGLHDDSRHASPWVAMSDLETLPFPDGTARENTEENRWELIKECPINKNWSAMIALVRGELRAFACEIMGHMASLHGDNPDWAGTGEPMPDLGRPVEKGWWRAPLAAFEGQFRGFCHHCSVPLNRPGQLAMAGEREEFSRTHAFIARPKVRGREVAFIGAETLEKRGRPSTEYLAGVTPGYKGD